LEFPRKYFEHLILPLEKMIEIEFIAKLKERKSLRELRCSIICHNLGYSQILDRSLIKNIEFTQL